MKSTRFSAAGAAFRPVAAAVLLALMAASSAGCGQRGPLYLPDAEPAAEADAGAGPDPADEINPDETPSSEDTE